MRFDLTDEQKSLRHMLAEFFGERFGGAQGVEAIAHTTLDAGLWSAVGELGLAGATVLKGSMGFGAHSVLHTTKLLELSTDLPIVIELVDTEEKIQTLLPHVQEMVKEGLITMETVRILPCGTRAVGSTAS